MAWDFETDPEFQEKLDWMDEFVREKVEPLGLLGIHPYDVKNPRRNKLVRPLQEEVKARGLWACHLGPELGGQGYGQVKLGLMNEILGGASFAIPAMQRSSLITERPNRKHGICSRCSKTKSFRHSP